MVSTPSPVVLLEFNELTPSLMDRFIAQGDLPAFARLRDQSATFVTEAEERGPHLEPWIQWVTVHTGLNHAAHGVGHLNEGHQLDAPRIWDLVSEQGRNVWVCGSMNIRYRSDLNGCALPDPWCTKTPPRPADLSPYFRFVQHQVLDHTNDSAPVDWSDYARFLSFMAAHGLSATTLGAIARQRWEERSGNSRWKRVVLLDLLQWDVFAHYYRRLQPALATFFLNSTAHYQHAYWDSMEPEAFTTAPADTEREHYRDAIWFGYKRMDALLARMLDVLGSDATIILCTALSQEAWTDHDSADGGSFYRPRSFDALTGFAGITDPHVAAPVMSEQFYLEFQTAAAAGQAAARLGAVALDRNPLLDLRLDGNRLFGGCRLHDNVPAEAMIDGGRAEARPFGTLFYKLPTTKSGKHHPDGMFWIRRPGGRRTAAPERVPLASVAPTILRCCGLTPPAHMQAEPVRL